MDRKKSAVTGEGNALRGTMITIRGKVFETEVIDGKEYIKSQVISEQFENNVRETLRQLRTITAQRDELLAAADETIKAQSQMATELATVTAQRDELLATIKLVYADKSARFGVDKATNIPISEIVRAAIFKSWGGHRHNFAGIANVEGYATSPRGGYAIANEGNEPTEQAKADQEDFDSLRDDGRSDGYGESYAERNA